MLAVRAWIYCVAYSGSILHYENLFCKLGKWLDWSTLPKTTPNWWCRKSSIEFSFVLMDDGVGLTQRQTCNNVWNWEKEIRRYGVCQKPSDDQVRTEFSWSILQENSTWEWFLESELCVPYGSVPFSFYSYLGLNEQQIFAFILCALCLCYHCSVYYSGINAYYKCVMYIGFIHDNW